VNESRTEWEVRIVSHAGPTNDRWWSHECYVVKDLDEAVERFNALSATVGQKIRIVRREVTEWETIQEREIVSRDTITRRPA
jgi:hypothetical protein